jgi:hypothetical protein
MSFLVTQKLHLTMHVHVQYLFSIVGFFEFTFATQATGSTEGVLSNNEQEYRVMCQPHLASSTCICIYTLSCKLQGCSKEVYVQVKERNAAACNLRTT